mmetsp:Transcript_67593/g.147230  ORF Transcript_67593/g.147230 Transcript_67593/m.147230 type:complete len:211 (+) Transcript_67593:1453-2085(+)
MAHHCRLLTSHLEPGVLVPVEDLAVLKGYCRVTVEAAREELHVEEEAVAENCYGRGPVLLGHWPSLEDAHCARMHQEELPCVASNRPEDRLVAHDRDLLAVLPGASGPRGVRGQNLAERLQGSALPLEPRVVAEEPVLKNPLILHGAQELHDPFLHCQHCGVELFEAVGGGIDDLSGLKLLHKRRGHRAPEDSHVLPSGFVFERNHGLRR